MKKTNLTLLFLSIVFFAYSQPSKSAMIAKIKSGESYISVKLLGSGYEKKYENNSWHYYFQQDFATRRKSQKYPGVTVSYSGGLLYEKIGGKYKYLRELIGYETFEGVKNPTVAEIKKIANSDMYHFLGTYYNNTVELVDISLPKEPKWKYNKVNAVQFEVFVTLKELHENKLSTVKRKLSMTVLSDGFKKPWKKLACSSSKAHNSDAVIISEKELSFEETAKIRTIEQTIQDKKAAKIIANLPTVGEIPKFQSQKQMAYFYHNIMMTKTPDEIKAYLYKGMSKRCFEKNSKILTASTKKWMDYIFEKDHLKAFRIAHCKYPPTYEVREKYVRFYDKQKKYILDYDANPEDGTYKIEEFSFYAPKPEEWERLKNLNENCKDTKPDLSVRIVNEYKKGDKVNAKFSNGTFPYVVEKRDNGAITRYYIKPEGNPNGRGYWLPETQLSPRTDDGKTSNGKTNDDKSSNTKKIVTFKVGDKVKVQTTKGWINGKVLKVKSNDCLIKFTGKKYRDTWMPKVQLKKAN